MNPNTPSRRFALRPIPMVLALSAAFVPPSMPVGAQTPQISRPVASSQLSSGCNGNGPGIVTGRAPGFGSGAAGSVRVIPGDANGDAFISAANEIDGTLQAVSNLHKDPKALAAFEKDPTSSPYIPHYTGPNNIDSILAWQRARMASFQRASDAASEIATTIIAKNGSFSCRGLRSGKYHIMIQFVAVSASEAMSLAPTGRGSQSIVYEAEAEVPRAAPGQHVLVEVNGYRQIMSITR